MNLTILRRALLASTALALGTLNVTSPVCAAGLQSVEIPVVWPLTGPAAGIGQELQESLEIAERSINESGGVRKRNLHSAFLDDQGQPQIAVQITNQMPTIQIATTSSVGYSR